MCGFDPKARCLDEVSADIDQRNCRRKLFASGSDAQAAQGSYGLTAAAATVLEEWKPYVHSRDGYIRGVKQEVVKQCPHIKTVGRVLLAAIA